MSDQWMVRWADLLDPNPTHVHLIQFWKSLRDADIHPTRDKIKIDQFLNEVWIYLALDEQGIPEAARQHHKTEAKLLKDIAALYGEHLPSWIDRDGFERARAEIAAPDPLTSIAIKRKQRTRHRAYDRFLQLTIKNFGTPAYAAVSELVTYLYGGVPLDPESMRKRKRV